MCFLFKSANIAPAMKDKGSLRTYYLELLKKQGSVDRQAKSQVIEQKLFELAQVQKAKTIMFYASLPGEVETFAMITKAIKLNKKICLPIVMQNQRNIIPTLIQTTAGLENGAYGIAQPKLDASKEVDLKEIDAVIVPGLAFDRFNNRLGRGAGFYDRFLAKLPQNTVTVGLAFDFQITDSLPVEEHDVPLSVILAN